MLRLHLKPQMRHVQKSQILFRSFLIFYFKLSLAPIVHKIAIISSFFRHHNFVCHGLHKYILLPYSYTLVDDESAHFRWTSASRGIVSYSLPRDGATRLLCLALDAPKVNGHLSSSSQRKFRTYFYLLCQKYHLSSSAKRIKMINTKKESLFDFCS